MSNIFNNHSELRRHDLPRRARLNKGLAGKEVLAFAANVYTLACVADPGPPATPLSPKPSAEEVGSE